MDSYRNPFIEFGPYGDDRHAAEPGWGGNPFWAGQGRVGVGALGESFPVKTAFGTVNVDIPISQMMQAAIDSGWPNIRAKLEAEIPSIVAAALPELKHDLPKIVAENLWPAIQPKIEAEINKVKRQALIGFIGLAALIVVVGVWKK